MTRQMSRLVIMCSVCLVLW